MECKARRTRVRDGRETGNNVEEKRTEWKRSTRTRGKRKEITSFMENFELKNYFAIDQRRKPQVNQEREDIILSRAMGSRSETTTTKSMTSNKRIFISWQIPCSIEKTWSPVAITKPMEGKVKSCRTTFPVTFSSTHPKGKYITYQANIHNLHEGLRSNRRTNRKNSDVYKNLHRHIVFFVYKNTQTHIQTNT